MMSLKMVDDWASVIKTTLAAVGLIVTFTVGAMVYFVPVHAFNEFKGDVKEWKLQDRKQELRTEKNYFYMEMLNRELTPNETQELDEIEEEYEDVKEQLKELRKK